MSSTPKGERNPRDAYQTPQWCIDLLAERLRVAGHRYTSILDAGCGDGRIGNTIGKKCVIGYVAGVDIEGLCVPLPTDYYKRDFLTMEQNDVRVPPDLVVMNPPFSLAFEFVVRAVHMESDVIALLNLHFLGSSKRAAWLAGHPPSWIAVLSPRPSFTGHGTDSVEYAWIGWEREPSGIGPIEFWRRQ